MISSRIAYAHFTGVSKLIAKTSSSRTTTIGGRSTLARERHQAIVALNNPSFARSFATTESSSQSPNNEDKPKDDASKTGGKFSKDAFASKLKDLKLGEKVGTVVNTTKEKLFAKDETSWKDALRAVFGLKPENPPKSEPTDGFTGTASTTGPAAETGQKTPEQEAKEFMEAQQNAHAGPSPFELKIEELVKEIQRLEKEREEAQNASDMPRFKELNKKTREVRKEIETLQQRMNTSSVVVVEERKGAWESFSDTLRDTPLLRGIFGFGETKAAKKLSSAAEDAREAWETSQHPLVYKVQSMWDSMFAETEMGEAIREFRKIDPNFTMEGFVQQMEEDIIPVVLSAFLKGDTATLNKYLSEGAYAAVKAAIDQRNQAGRKMDPNILNIQHAQVAAAKVVEKMGPICVVQFMAQQVDVLYDMAGNVVEGKDDQVAAVFYAFAMTRHRSDTDGSLRWVVSEFAIVGTVPWI